MVKLIADWYRWRREQPYVRPWGLTVPISVLVICLPLLRPLRHPDPRSMSDNEVARLATVEALVEHRTLAVDHTSLQPRRELITSIRGSGRGEGEGQYSKQPPVLAFLLAGPYWVMHEWGLSFSKDLALTSYLLTLLGATLPVAMAAGLVYRLGRLFELRRPWRMGLAFAAVFGSGLVSYATVLNTHAPAAALILAACGALFHAGTARHRGQSHGWLAMGGLAASLAAVIDFSAFVFLVLLVFVILAMHWPVASRVGGMVWYGLGALPPLALHAALMMPITGDFRPGFLHGELQPATVAATQWVDEDEEDEGPSWASQTTGHVVDGLIGRHGLFSHFPVLLLGVWGIGMVLHRHWPAPAKTLAMVTVVGAVLIIGVYAGLNADWEQPMFAVRWFVPFLPLTVFWGGVWLRKQHHPAVWGVAGVLLGFSVMTTMLGATAPFTHCGNGEYTAYAAAKQLINGTQTIQIMANNRPPLPMGER